MAMLLQPEDRQKLEARLYVRVWCPGVSMVFLVPPVRGLP